MLPDVIAAVTMTKTCDDVRARARHPPQSRHGAALLSSPPVTNTSPSFPPSAPPRPAGPPELLAAGRLVVHRLRLHVAQQHLGQPHPGRPERPAGRVGPLGAARRHGAPRQRLHHGRRPAPLRLLRRPLGRGAHARHLRRLFPVVQDAEEVRQRLPGGLGRRHLPRGGARVLRAVGRRAERHHVQLARQRQDVDGGVLPDGRV